MNIAILGTGKMGGIVGKQLAGAGYDVTFGSRNPEATKYKFEDLGNIRVTTYEDALSDANVILIAVPWAFTLDLLSNYKSGFDGKIIVDMTNPLSPDVSSLLVGGDDSSAERIADLLPGACVVKALNGITADNLPEPVCHGEKTQVFYCSDYDDANGVVRQLIEDLGYEPVGCGGLTNARYLEAMAMLWLQMAFWENRGNELRFKIIV